MTPAEYVEVVVFPTFRDFIQAPTDRRLAYLTMISAYHLVDYLMRTSAPSDRKARDAETKRIENEIEKRCGGDFHVVEGMCNGSKHCGRDTKARAQFTPGDETRSVTFGFGTGPGIGGFGQGHFGPPRLIVFHDGKPYVVDIAARAFLLAAVDAFPQHLGAVDLTGIRPEANQPV
ncbi:hypothetical protein MFUR16E_04665 [Methylobacterium fujisawaense]|uniref:hypothetical protein n=1 Tax=Methylobacterium fujisawaense TaxID=107400 RepID=UPI002F31BB54